jgi:hypothetical protein
LTEGNQPVPVVLAPDVILAGLFDPQAREVLNAWRDGAIKLVLSRRLLVAYLRALRKAGAPAGVLRGWALWFHEPGRAELAAMGDATEGSLAAHCSALARIGKGKAVICWRRPETPEATDWKTAGEWLARA